MSTLAISGPIFEQFRTWLSNVDETAGVLVLRRGAGGELLVARELISVPEEAYAERGPRRLKINSSGYVPALRRAAELEAIACFVHSHPGGDPRPSLYDDEVDEDLRELFQLRSRQELYVSLIIGGTAELPSLTARCYGQTGPSSEISRFRIVGPRLRVIENSSEIAANEEVFDRQIRAFGRAGQETIRRLKVAVVGAGGTGSAVAEQLLRLGVGDLLIVDNDLITTTNLTRIHESRSADVDKPKVHVAKRLAEDLGFGARVVAIPGRVTEQDVARKLADRDVIFGCTDDHAGRVVLSRIAYWYLALVIDVGVTVTSVDGNLSGIFGRVTTVAPGDPCLICREVVDPVQARIELLPDAERSQRVAEGYAAELGEPDPSVIAYTTLVGSLAVSQLLDRLFDTSLGRPVGELLLRVHDHSLRRIAGESLPNHYCAVASEWAHGDQQPLLGLVWGS